MERELYDEFAKRNGCTITYARMMELFEQLEQYVLSATEIVLGRYSFSMTEVIWAWKALNFHRGRILSDLVHLEGKIEPFVSTLDAFNEIAARLRKKL